MEVELNFTDRRCEYWLRNFKCPKRADLLFTQAGGRKEALCHEHANGKLQHLKQLPRKQP
jgi:hypothetical protein